MQSVFVLDTNKQPCDPVHPAAARKLLDQGRAAVFKRYPFTIILKEERQREPKPLRLKIDPGSKLSGLAVTDENRVLFAAELQHRGQRIRAALEERRSLRRGRRYRKTRYRPTRFNNRRRAEGWLPPSLGSRIANVGTWVRRLSKIAPIQALSLELVKFDTQAMQNPEIEGSEYQQGTLAGYELREYLLEKWQRTCAYCGTTEVPLQIEHIQPRSRGGSSRTSNLTLACEPCNVAKGNQPVEEFLAGKPAVLKRIKAHAKAPIRDAAAVNTIRWALYWRLQATGLPIECGTGGRTKFNRVQQGYPKAHWIDAACVGKSGGDVVLEQDQNVLEIKAMGHGNRQMCGTDKFGFPIRHRTRNKFHFGFQTGDLVRAIVEKGKAAGTHIGRVAVRQRPSFRVNGFDIHPKYMCVLQRGDGYAYSI